MKVLRMLSAESVVKLDGISTSQVEGSVEVNAVDYRHAALDDVPIVRLVRSNEAGVDDALTAAVGLAPVKRIPVGFQVRRVLGFPGWAVINAPDHASIAVGLLPQFRQAEELAETSPNAAKDSFAKLAEQLKDQAPHFLPTFWEEAGRSFLRAENQASASQMFTRARDAERAHDLPIDETRHQAVFEEFISAGAVTAKELSAEAKALSDRLGDSRAALEAFLRLVRVQIRAGVAPSASLPGDIRRLADTAGRDTFEVEAPLVRAVIKSGSISKVPTGAWKAWAPTVKRIISEEPELASVFFTFIPASTSRDIHFKSFNAWIEFLEASGLSVILTHDLDDDTAVSWIHMALRYLRRTSWSRNMWEPLSVDPTEPLRKIIGQMTQLNGNTVTFRQIDARLCDALVRAGANLKIDKFDRLYSDAISFSGWEARKVDFDFSALAQFITDHPALIINLHNSAESEDFLRHPGAVSLIEHFVRSFTEKYLHVEDPDLTYDQLKLLTYWLEPLSRLPEARSNLSAELDRLRQHGAGTRVLATSLRQGLLTEYDWPEMQEAIDELVATYPPQKDAASSIQFHPSWPWIGVSVLGEGRVIYLRGRQRAADATFPVSNPGRRWYNNGPHFLF